MSFAWSVSVPHLVFLQMIWAIGWAMVALAGLVWPPRSVILGVGIALIAGHNLLDPVTPSQFGQFAWLWMACTKAASGP